MLISYTKQRGFSLIEILIVVFIIGLLASIVVVNVMPEREVAIHRRVQSDFTAIKTALKMYKLDHSHFPSEADGLQALTTPPQDEPTRKRWRTGGYLEKLPLDPWENAYEYRLDKSTQTVSIISAGSDGILNSEDDLQSE